MKNRSKLGVTFLAAACLLTFADSSKQSNHVEAASTGVVETLSNTNVLSKYGNRNTFTGQVLKPHTRWKYSDKVWSENSWFYKVGKNQWITTRPWFNQTLNNQPATPSTPTLTLPKNGTVNIYSRVSVFSKPGNMKWFTGKMLSTNTAWKYTDIKQFGNAFFYKVGANQWITTNGWFNQKPVNLLRNTPVYNAINGNSVGTLPKGYTPITNSRKSGTITWYQTIGGLWFSPAYEHVKNWSYTGNTTLPILAYHDFDNIPGNVWEVPYAQFTHQMDLLKSMGYYTISSEDAYYIMTTGYRPARNLVWVTLDDGYKSWINAAQYVHNNHQGFTGFQIINSMTAGWGLNSNQVGAMSKIMDIQSHTVSHKLLTEKSTYEQSVELGQSKSVLQNITGKTPIALAYPHGKANKYTFDNMDSQDYWLGLNLYGGLANASNGLYSLSRIPVYPNISDYTFKQLVYTGLYPY